MSDLTAAEREDDTIQAIKNELAEAVARAMLKASQRLEREAGLAWPETTDLPIAVVEIVTEEGPRETLAQFDR